MSPPDPGKQERIEEFLRKSLLGEEIINTQFHLFSAKSSTSDRVVKPRVLCANNILLAKSSKYFLDLLSSDIHPSDPSLSDLVGDNDMPSKVGIDEYGYGSDSDLDDEEEEEEPPIRIVETEAPNNRPGNLSAPPAQLSVVTQPKDDDELSDDGSESVSSDMFVMSPEHPKMDPPPLLNVDALQSVASSETAVQEDSRNKSSANPSSAATRLRSLGSRHVLVKDTAFQTWYTLLNYLYTGKYSFLPLSSAAPGGQSYVSSTSARDEPECSAKSMYRLACKVGLDHLRDEAMAHIRNNLSENNILKELSCSLVSRHPELLEMELDILYTHIASPPVVAGFPVLARRIALRELPQGADIIVGFHTRVLKERQSLPPTPRLALEPGFTPPPRTRAPPTLFGGPAEVLRALSPINGMVRATSVPPSPVDIAAPLDSIPAQSPVSWPNGFGFGFGQAPQAPTSLELAMDAEPEPTMPSDWGMSVPADEAAVLEVSPPPDVYGEEPSKSHYISDPDYVGGKKNLKSAKKGGGGLKKGVKKQARPSGEQRIQEE